MSDMDGGNKAEAICQLWKVQSFCSTISSLALWGSRGSGVMFQDPGPASWVLRGAGPQAGQYDLLVLVVAFWKITFPAFPEIL